jgi:hypothetical protein
MRSAMCVIQVCGVQGSTVYYASAASIALETSST